MNIATNFTRSEVLNWSDNVRTMSAKDRQKAKGWATQDISEVNWQNAKLIANHLQFIRNMVNKQFPEYKGKIGIMATSWFRPHRWERYRRRSGASSHVDGHAVDFIVTGVRQEDFQKIMDWIWEMLNSGSGWEGGLARLHRKQSTSFIHIDLGRKRRWNY